MSPLVSTNQLATPAMTPPVLEPAQYTAAKIVGFLYPIQMATGILGHYVRGQMIVAGDATKTAQNILESERLFRLSIAADVVTCSTVIVLVWAFYILVRPIDRNLALLAVFFRLVENAVLCVAAVNSLVLLKLVGGTDYLQIIGTSQLHSFARLALSAQGLGMNVAFILLGLGSAVFAWLLLKSRYVPKALAAWGIFSSLLLAVGTLAIIVFPGLGVGGLAYMMPMGIYEVGLGLWLILKGVRAPRI